jgi:phosphatidylinositol phospholipase C, delta
MHFGNKSLDFVFDSPEDATAWSNAVITLTENKTEITFANRLKRDWDRYADKKSGKIHFKDVPQLLDRVYNISLPKEELKGLLSAVDENKDGLLDVHEFEEFTRRLRAASEIDDVFKLYAGDNNYISGAKLKELLDIGESVPFTEAEITQMLCAFDREGKEEGLNIFDFEDFMHSGFNDIFNMRQESPGMEMNRPLTEYWISSSHNTYLTGNQLNSSSSAEMYSRALQTLGFRCVELDCWDGKDGSPEIYHGHTLTSRVKFEDVCKVVKQYGFERNPWPIIFSLEMHCSQEQQVVLAGMLQAILGDTLAAPLPAGTTVLPSPVELQGKVLLKGKSFATAEVEGDDEEGEEATGEATGESEAGESPPGKKPSAKIAQELSDLIFLRATHCPGLREEDKMAAHEMCSFSENKTKKYVEKKGTDLVFYNRRSISRIYPKGTRVDSSNYDPVTPWNYGCQMVALNIQTFDEAMRRNQIRFRESQGFVLKPPILRAMGSAEIDFDPSLPENVPAELMGAPSLRLTVEVIGAQHLPKVGKLGEGTSSKGEVIDPYVVVQVNGLPCDEWKEQTSVVDNNGFCPRWRQSFSTTVRYPSFAVFIFTIFDRDINRDDFVAYGGAPVTHLRSGLRSVKLFRQDHSSATGTSLLVNLKIDRETA